MLRVYKFKHFRALRMEPLLRWCCPLVKTCRLSEEWWRSLTSNKLFFSTSHVSCNHPFLHSGGGDQTAPWPGVNYSSDRSKFSKYSSDRGEFSTLWGEFSTLCYSDRCSFLFKFSFGGRCQPSILQIVACFPNVPQIDASFQLCVTQIDAVSY